MAKSWCNFSVWYDTSESFHEKSIIPLHFPPSRPSLRVWGVSFRHTCRDTKSNPSIHSTRNPNISRKMGPWDSFQNNILQYTPPLLQHIWNDFVTLMTLPPCLKDKSSAKHAIGYNELYVTKNEMYHCNTASLTRSNRTSRPCLNKILGHSHSTPRHNQLHSTDQSSGQHHSTL